MAGALSLGRTRPRYRAWPLLANSIRLRRRSHPRSVEQSQGQLSCSLDHKVDPFVSLKMLLIPPDTARRSGRPNPENWWLREPMPEQGLIDDLWAAVQNRQKAVCDQLASYGRKRKRLPSGLMDCGVCQALLAEATELQALSPHLGIAEPTAVLAEQIRAALEDIDGDVARQAIRPLIDPVVFTPL